MLAKLKDSGEFVVAVLCMSFQSSPKTLISVLYYMAPLCFRLKDLNTATQRSIASELSETTRAMRQVCPSWKVFLKYVPNSSIAPNLSKIQRRYI